MDHSDTLSQITQLVSTAAELFGGGNPLGFVTQQVFTTKPQIFHSGGNLTEDISTREGCSPERMYQTAMGAMGSLSGGLGGGSNSARNSNETYKNTGYGGIPITLISENTDVVPCEEAQSPAIPDNYSIEPSVDNVPAGYNVALNAITLPSAEQNAAQNFVNGIPNTIVITNPGKQYWYRNVLKPNNGFPLFMLLVMAAH